MVTPFFFGPSARRLFGVYDPAHKVDSKTRLGAVICYPWGSEYVYAHRSLRHLASRLSESGIETLRFDYYGTGDSAGEMTETDLSGWQHDIEVAIAELMDLSGTKRVALLGLRLGANLAASVAAKRGEHSNPLLLWDPIVSGKVYLQQLHVAKGDEPTRSPAPISRPETIGGGFEIDGFPLTSKMALEFERLDFSNSLVEASENSLVILSSQEESNAPLRSAAEQMPESNVRLELVEDSLAWVERPQNIGTIPIKVIGRIVEWMSQWR